MQLQFFSKIALRNGMSVACAVVSHTHISPNSKSIGFPHSCGFFPRLAKAPYGYMQLTTQRVKYLIDQFRRNAIDKSMVINGKNPGFKHTQCVYHVYIYCCDDASLSGDQFMCTNCYHVITLLALIATLCQREISTRKTVLN